ncbi:glycosyltransferase [Sphingomonas sp. LHG3406-1]|uniref:glycosyltransferase n=1 Tax=Sphingomonas sp. LHG3406-1 TaxID=2804617 RepID=UPI00260C54AE|nr:glycosyltransferase [Sphingomonas sp. LHG3406-1]
MPASASPRPLDVALLMFDFGPTGVVRNALRIARAGAAAGLNVELWVAQDTGALRADVPEGVPVVAFGTPLGTSYTRADRRRAGRATVPAIARLLEERRPAVMLSAGNHFHSFAAWAMRLADVPTRLLLRISTGLPRPHSLNPYRWARYAWKRRRAIRRQRQADLLIAVSQEVAAELRRDTGVPAHKVIAIPNGIDSAAIAERQAAPLDHAWFAPGQPPVILGVGRIDKYKNFELLIDAFARLRARQPLRLMILGEERGAWLHRLEARIEKLGVAADVRFEGFQADPQPFFQAAAAYVCCSRYEGMSNAMLEAMANGCPVVATRTATGAAELLDDGRLGPLAAPGAAALADAIAARLAASRDSAALRARARDYDLRQSLDAYVALLATLSGRPLPSADQPAVERARQAALAA